jgi:hypothetical protein
MHNRFVKKCDERYNYYRAYNQFSSEYRTLDRNDRDGYVREAQSTWGAQMHIPYAFSTVETILPRLLSNNPRMIVTPREMAAEETVENMKMTINTQQAQAQYPLTLQSIGKDGLIYGLGVGKTMWRREDKPSQKYLRRGIHSDWVVDSVACKAYDDPDALSIDPRDFIWDPLATSVKSMRWAVHRTWHDTGYILYKVRSGQWNMCGDLSEDDLKGTHKTKDYETALQPRSTASKSDFTYKGDDVHEVWEFHNGEKVIVVVDGVWPVHVDDNPYWHGEIPFQVFRPTEVTHELIGVSAIEILTDLIDEMNTLRMQRRDNATISLQKPFIFNELMFDSADLALGPGLGIPTTGDVNESIRPLEFGEIPFSGYREEDNLRADIERTSGISDSVAGGEGQANQTATGAQLVHDAANLRIKNMTTRIEFEIIEPQGRQWLKMNQQFITEQRDIRVEVPDPTGPDKRYLWFPVGPAELAGEMNINVVGGSTAADNIPQMRQDGQSLWTMMGQDPRVNGRKLMAKVLEDYGVANPDEYLAPEQEMVPAEALNAVGNALVTQGADPDMIQQIIDEALGQADQTQEQPVGPDPLQTPPQEEEPEGATDGN